MKPPRNIGVPEKRRRGRPRNKARMIDADLRTNCKERKVSPGGSVNRGKRTSKAGKKPSEKPSVDTKLNNSGKVRRRSPRIAARDAVT